MKRLALLPAALALCATMQDSPVTMQPGQWEFTTAMTGVEMPGSPREMVEAARSALGAPKIVSRCVSPEEAADPSARLANPGGGASNCTFSRRTFADGRIDVAGSCTTRDGDPLEVSLSGSYTPTNIRAAIRADAARRTMLLTGTMTALRTGDCAPWPS